MTRRDEHLALLATGMMNGAKSLCRDVKEAKRMICHTPNLEKADELGLPEPARLALHYLAMEIVHRLGIDAAYRVADRYAQMGKDIRQYRTSPDSRLGDGEQLACEALYREITNRRIVGRLYQEDSADEEVRQTA